MVFMYKPSFISKSENSSHATLEILDEPKLPKMQMSFTLSLEIQY
jgi:hypothetical protein